MRSFTKIIALLSLFSLNLIEAQQVVKKDTISGIPLTITMDKRIEDMLVSQEEKCLTSNTRNVSASDDDSHNVPKIVVPERELSQAEICRRNPRIMGYKIQLAVVKSNEEAKEVGIYFRRRFPNMKVEIDASLRPNYKVMAGSYLSKQSAAPDLASIKKYFENAVAIQYRVFCVEAK